MVARLLSLLGPIANWNYSGLTDRQLDDIGVEPAAMARLVELRAFDTFGGPSGQVQTLLWHRSPAA